MRFDVQELAKACAVVLVASTPALALTSNCPTANFNTTMSTVNAESNGMSGGSTISTGGCIATDETFGNFGISGFTGGLSISNQGFETVPTNTAQEIYTGLNLALSGGSTITTNLTFVTQFGTGTQPAVNPGVTEIILDLPAAYISAESGGSVAYIELTLGVCENPTSDGSAGNSGSLSTFSGTNGSTCATFGGTYESVSVTFSNTTSATEMGDLSVALALPGTISTLIVDDTITLHGYGPGNTGGGASYPAVQNYFEAAEPSTLALLASALAGLMAWRKTIVSIDSWRRFFGVDRCRDESRHGTQERVRHEIAC